MAFAAFAGMAMASPTWAADDATFLTDAIQGSIAEVQMGQLAQKNGGSDEVRAFGSKLVTDHSAAMDQASALAQSMGTKVPTEPKEDAREMYQKLEGMKGEEFDEAFAEHMVEDHKKDIEKFEEQSKAGSGQVADFAKATLPTLQQHLEIAQSLEK